MPEDRLSRRNTFVGAVTVTALIASFALAVLARGKADVPVVIVAPAGSMIRLDGDTPRELPPQPNTPNTLASYYFLTQPGVHEVRFQEPNGPHRSQDLSIPASRVPVIYTLLRDTLREMKARSR
jgi:hypothetical protein